MGITCDRDNRLIADGEYNTVSEQSHDGSIRIIHLCREHLEEYRIVVNAYLEG